MVVGAWTVGDRVRLVIAADQDSGPSFDHASAAGADHLSRSRDESALGDPFYLRICRRGRDRVRHEAER
ncbi:MULTISPECIES: hypothetical protein [Pseudofrankia]|uniref:hypothetical protein n=1 Tax=Pseudofrankia TaxID=2994363 RepID=UPI000482BB03|nr:MULTISPECIES: hypothetical protein [Pseudofrankia]OHV34143.1 hypothetical protein BCD49_24670 [Pseudofrankia sp. EUN1h]